MSQAITAAARVSRVLLLAPLVQLTYRAQAIIGVLDVVSRIFLFTVLWSAVYKPGQTSGGMDVHQAITYSALASLLVSGRAWPVDTFSDRIREGTIVYVFMRPVPPLLYFFALQLLSGALVPIWFFPDWAITLLAWSPFAAATSTPVSLYIGRIPADSIIGALALQVAWLLALMGLVGLLWRRARDRVIVQGG